MALGINTNVNSLTAQRNLNSTQNSLSTSLQRLSSGLRINSAKDDAAGLAISARFTAQIRGLNQAARNANDGVSLAQTAEGALGQIGDSLQRVRELSVQAANASNSASDRAALQQEITQALSEVDRVGTQTSFNGTKLLNGSFTSQAFQVGADAGETITINSILDSRIASLGSHTLTADGTVTGGVVAAAAATVNNGIAAATAATNFTIETNTGRTTAIAYAANSGANDIASAINAAASSIGVTATATNSTTLSGLNVAGTVSFNLNGSSITSAVTDVNDLSGLVSSINGVAGSTGVTASFATSAKNSITLTTTDGRNIKLENFANSAATLNDTVNFGGTTLTEGGSISAVKTGLIELSSTAGPIRTANAAADVFTAAGVNNSSMSSLAALDVSTQAGATNALKVLDAALAQVNTGRAALGALQNRLSSTISNLQTATENLSASRSRILDADFAQETANLSRSQVLQQAGTAMLQQANAAPNNVLSLLRG